jgi:hypothetical protein
LGIRHEGLASSSSAIRRMIPLHETGPDRRRATAPSRIARKSPILGSCRKWLNPGKQVEGDISGAEPCRVRGCAGSGGLLLCRPTSPRPLRRRMPPLALGDRSRAARVRASLGLPPPRPDADRGTLLPPCHTQTIRNLRGSSPAYPKKHGSIGRLCRPFGKGMRDAYRVDAAQYRGAGRCW